MFIIDLTEWTEQIADPIYDGNNPMSTRSAFTVYADADYPAVPSSEPALSDQRWVGGAGANDSNDGILVSNGGTGPWATFDKALQELCASSTWYCLNINDDLTVSTTIDTKFYGSGPGSALQFAYIRGEPSLGTPPTISLEAEVQVDGQNHWLWYGFDILLGEVGVTTVNGIGLGEDTATSNHTFRQITGTMQGLGGDNIGFFKAIGNNVKFFGVFNCKLTGPGTDAAIHGNTSCIFGFRMESFRWENNEVELAPRALYQKHANLAADGPADIHIRYNWDKQSTAGNQNLGCFFAGRDEGGVYEVTDNIFGNNVEISNGGGADQPTGIEFVGNTCQRKVDIQDGNDPSIEGLYRDNIIQGNFIIYNSATSENSDNISNYNLYVEDIVYKGTSNTLSQWRAASVPVGQDVNSIAGSPTYTAGATPTTVAGFALTAASNGYQAASDGKDMGADITKVGNK